MTMAIIIAIEIRFRKVFGLDHYSNEESCIILNLLILKNKSVRTQFVTTHNNAGFARKNAQIISLIERGFKRLGLSHWTKVSRDVYTELNRVRSRSPSP